MSGPQTNPSEENRVKRFRQRIDRGDVVESPVGEFVLWSDYELLRSALVHSVAVIQTWHNMEIPAKERSALWDIYWRNAPEMKPIREALSGDSHG